MKRHPALHDLSRDHHTILVKCQAVRRAFVRGADAAELRRLAATLVDFYASDLRPHFEEEDAFVQPLAEAVGDAALRTTARELHGDHAWISERMVDLASPQRGPGDILAALEPRLTRHVRREEAELFEALQTVASEEQLQDMWRRAYAFRVAHRSSSACTLKPA